MLRIFLIFALVVLMCGCDNSAKTNTSPSPSATSSSTDTKIPTVMDQKENKEDVARTADIRQKVMDAKLSVRAQNVKIITKDGHVTLTGTVDTADEKSKIEELAKAVAGDGNVENLLEVKAPE
jgi:hyperosmotically inducible periplasmic protein